MVVVKAAYLKAANSTSQSIELVIRLPSNRDSPQGELPLWLSLNAGYTERALEELQNAIIKVSRNNSKAFQHMKFLVSVLVPDEKRCEAVRLQLRKIWVNSDEVLRAPAKVDRFVQEMLGRQFPDGRPRQASSRDPKAFYTSAYMPNGKGGTPTQLQSNLVECQLFPFQKRAVEWLLRREGMIMNQDGQIVQAFITGPGDLPPSFRAERDAVGRNCYVSNLFGVVSADFDKVKAIENTIYGGILAEEMGLGKTVEMISLICLHQQDTSGLNNVTEKASGKTLRNCKATLIITPPSILQQWKDEIRMHAPSLKVQHYEGMAPAGAEETNEAEEIVSEFLDCDVVLVTYQILSKEIYYASEPSSRRLRNEKRYIPRRSPLTLVCWWRVCLDEAQMVENSVSNAAIVARALPRRNAWAVTGTPVRKNVKDLFGLLLFLHYEPYCQTATQWHLLVSQYPDTFKQVFGKIALRHSKADVRAEIQLPPQKRVVITIPFTPVEEQNYNQLFQDMCNDIGLDEHGAPLSGLWDPDSPSVIEKMRTWLARLRQTCLHPEVGGQNRRALGRNEGPLRTVQEVLEVMIEQNEVAARTEERTYLLTKIKRGQVYEKLRKVRKALRLWQEALTEIKGIVSDCREQLRLLEIDIRSDRERNGRTDPEKGSDVPSMSINEDTYVDRSSKITTWKARLRGSLELEHACTFFAASAYFQLKSDGEQIKPNSSEFKELEKQESDAYEVAKALRKEMLREVLGKVDPKIIEVARLVKRKSHARIPEINFELEGGGIESRDVFRRLFALGELLNEQAIHVTKWRESLVSLLQRPLVDQEDSLEIQGDEYDKSAKEQDEVYVYMAVLRAAAVDRHDALTGEENALVKLEMRDALDQARRGQGHDPTLTVAMLSLRNQYKPHPSQGSIRSLLSELRALATTLRNKVELDGAGSRASSELAIIEAALQRVQRVMDDQSKVYGVLEAELNLFRDTMNARLEYYKQLQAISTSVTPIELGSALERGKQDFNNQRVKELISKFKAQEVRSHEKMSSLKAKSRYLVHLRAESSGSGSDRLCVICQHNFEVGALTICGHQYCRDCFRLWWSAHRTCPICKRRLNATEFHEISYKPRELLVQEEAQATRQKNEVAAESSIYSGINSKTLDQIKTIDLNGSFGTKIDTLGRHLLWLRDNDAGAKSVIFSQYRDFLQVLQTSLKKFKIRYSSFGEKDGISNFKNNPDIECFLLHARAQASGLNLVNATHVFLCEPLINTALELQAIARVHRIGQRRPTTVWMYLISDTVEETIYRLSVDRRLSHIGRGELEESSLEVANSMELQRVPLENLLASKSHEGEHVQKDDLWSCLFGASIKQKSNHPANLEIEVNRHLRASAAEGRIEVAQA